jgi:hypothetical protein
MKSDQHNASRRREHQRLSVASEQRGKLVVEDFDNLLTRRNASEHFLTERFFAHSRDKIFGYLIVNVRFQQSQTDLPKRVGNVALRNGPVATEVLENVLKAVG